MSVKKRPFFSDCVGWPKEHLDALDWLQDEAEDIDLKTFKSSISKEDYDFLVSSLGYSKSKKSGMVIEDDYHVKFKRDPTTGITFVVHSAIEYVFAEREEIEKISRDIQDKDLEDRLQMEM